MSLGMVISSVAFLISGFVQIAIEKELTVVPKSYQYSTVFYNPLESDPIFVKGRDSEGRKTTWEIEAMGRSLTEEIILEAASDADTFLTEF